MTMQKAQPVFTRLMDLVLGVQAITEPMGGNQQHS